MTVHHQADGPGVTPEAPGPSAHALAVVPVPVDAPGLSPAFGHLALVPPLPVCDEPSPKGRWRCIRDPHPEGTYHVFAAPAGKARKRGGR